jgi:hypothetical protein
MSDEQNVPIGEIVADDEQHEQHEQQPSIGARIKTAVKAAADAVSSDGTKLVLWPTKAVVRVNPKDYPRNYPPFFELKDVGLLRRLYREALERLSSARHAVTLAEQRMADLKKLAEQDGLGREWALLGTPKPPDPAYPELVRVRALQPFTRYYQRSITREFAEWARVCQGRDASEMFQPLGYSAIGAGHVLDVPKAMLDELVREGLAERVESNRPKQLPDGRLVD